MSRDAQLILKHGCDRAAATVLLLLLSPFLIGLSLLILVSNGWPALFIQDRVGKDGKIFRLYKFRTMVRDAVRRGLGTTVGKSDDRITWVGGW
ncbi:MAG: sugar transferase, partial [Nitrospirota bacterium]